MVHDFTEPIEIDLPPIFLIQLIPQLINLDLCHIFPLRPYNLL